MQEMKTIVEHFKHGDAAAFDLIYKKYSKKLFGFAFGLTKNYDVSSEIVQEVFVNLWIKRDKVDTNLNIENYIFIITYNSVRKYFHKKKLETKVKSYLLKNSPEGIEKVDEDYIFNELLTIANRSIEKLPPQRKLVYKLSRQEGLKIKDIASRMNISPRTAEHQLAKALKFLKEELAQISLLMMLFFYLFVY